MLPLITTQSHHAGRVKGAVRFFLLNLLSCLLLLSLVTIAAATVVTLSGASDETEGLIPEPKADSLLPDLCHGRHLMENLTGRWRMRYLHYFKEPAHRGVFPGIKSQESDEAELLLEWSTWATEDRWRLGVSGWAEAGTRESLWGDASDFIQDTEARRPCLNVNELFLRYYADNCDIVAGKQVIRHGFGHIYSPADRFGPRDYSDPFDERSLGVWLLSLDCYFPSFSVTGAVLPVFQPSRFPGPESRWAVNPTGINLMSGFNLRLEGTRYVPDVDFDTVSLLTLVKTNLAGWDLYALGYYGVNPYPTARLVDLDIDLFSYPLSGPDITVRYASDYFNVLDVGAGFIRTWGRLAVYGEGLYQIAVEGEDDDCLDYLCGISLRLGGGWSSGFAEEITAYLEYTGMWVTRSKTTGGAELPSRSFITGGENLFLGRMDLQLNARTALNLSVGATESGRDSLCRIEGRFRVRPQWLVRLALGVFHVDTAGYFGPWGNNDCLSAAVEYRF